MIQIEVGDIVQVPHNSKNQLFRGCILIVIEITSFGAKCYIPIPGNAQAVATLAWDEMDVVGRAASIATKLETLPIGDPSELD